jgi:hypothetical protein
MIWAWTQSERNAKDGEKLICLSRQVGLCARRQTSFLNEIQRTFVFDSVT